MTNVRYGQPSVKQVLTTGLLSLVGTIGRTPIERMHVKKNSTTGKAEIVGTSSSGHTNKLGWLQAWGWKKAHKKNANTPANKPAHEVAHNVQHLLLAGAQQKGIINVKDSIKIMNAPGKWSKFFGYLWGGRGEKAAERMEVGQSAHQLFGNMKVSGREYFRSKPFQKELVKSGMSAAQAKKTAMAKQKAFNEHLNTLEAKMKVDFPHLFPSKAIPPTATHPQNYYNN
jgi:hypothetical protein